MGGPSLLAEYFSVHFAALAADLTAMVTHPAFFGVLVLVVLALLCPIVLAWLDFMVDDFEWLFIPLALASPVLFLCLAFHFASWCGV